MPDKELLEKLCGLIRYDILISTTAAGSGHPTSSLSTVELMTTLFFGDFIRFDINDPKNLMNDKVIFSKGHASPLLYSLYHAAGAITTEELLSLRKFGSVLEGHPTPRSKFVEVATGSLGQGLSVGVGMALGIKLKFESLNSNSETNSNATNSNTRNVSNFDIRISGLKQKLPRVFVLLGDSEIDEGQVWEAIESASRYKLDNLVGILDVNKIGQYGETDEGWDLDKYKRKFEAFGWNTIIIKDGNNLEEVCEAYFQFDQRLGKQDKSDNLERKPTVFIAKTVKGKGISFLENKDGWHGKVLSNDQLKTALKELGDIDFKARGKINTPEYQIANSKYQDETTNFNSILSKLEKYKSDSKETAKEISTREAYGNSLVGLGSKNQNIVVLDAGVANSTYSDKFRKNFPDRFFELSIAEENMMSVALGLSKMKYIPFLSTFAAFLTQTFDQIRMAQYSDANLKITGSHSGVSIGQDGPSQMGLEDIAMMRSILNSVVFYPADGVTTKNLTNIMLENHGIFYLRTTRASTPIIYDESEQFKIGGCKIHKAEVNSNKKILILSAGITLHEALKAQQKTAKDNIEAVVMDCYSVKPLDDAVLTEYISEYKNVIVVEDHYPYGGFGEAISGLIVNHGLRIMSFSHLCVRKLPKSGKPEELLNFEEIDSAAIVRKVKEMVKV